MSIWDRSPQEILGGWEARYPAKSLMDRLLTPQKKSKKNRKIKEKLDQLSNKIASIKQAEAQWTQESLDLKNYTPYSPVQDIDLREAPQHVIQAELVQRQEQQRQRIGYLSELVAPWGIKLDDNLITLDALELWFSKYLHLFSKKEFLEYIGGADSNNPYYHCAAPIWYSIGTDISLYMMAMLQNELSGTRWGISDRNKQDEFFNRPVILCSDNSTYHADFEPLIWNLMQLMSDHYIPNRFFDSFSTEYKKVRTGCRKIIKAEHV
jgi:hypothetical protein